MLDSPSPVAQMPFSLLLAIVHSDVDLSHPTPLFFVCYLLSTVVWTMPATFSISIICATISHSIVLCLLLSTVVWTMPATFSISIVCATISIKIYSMTRSRVKKIKKF